MFTLTVIGCGSNGANQGQSTARSSDYGIPRASSYVAVGDSFASGEGNKPFLPGTFDSSDSCHRSMKDAYPVLLSAQPPPGIPKLAPNGFLACSGARIQAMFDKNRDNSTETPTSSGAIQGQLYSAAFAKHVGLVTIQVGGDNLDVAELIKKCVPSRTAGYCPSQVKQHEKKLSSIDGTKTPGCDTCQTLSNVYVAARRQAPDARILVIGYPREFDPGKSAGQRLHLSSDDVTALNDLGDQLDKTITDNVKLANQTKDARVEYVPQSVSFFRGHEQGTRLDAWNGLNSGDIKAGACGACAVANEDINGSFHPDAFGQWLFHVAVLDYLSQHRSGPRPRSTTGQSSSTTSARPPSSTTSTTPTSTGSTTSTGSAPRAPSGTGGGQAGPGSPTAAVVGTIRAILENNVPLACTYVPPASQGLCGLASTNAYSGRNIHIGPQRVAGDRALVVVTGTLCRTSNNNSASGSVCARAVANGQTLAGDFDQLFSRAHRHPGNTGNDPLFACVQLNGKWYVDSGWSP